MTAGFLVSAAIVARFMVRGVLAARRGDIVLHRRAMRHVVAQMSVAVTSRAMLLGFDAVGVRPRPRLRRRALGAGRRERRGGRAFSLRSA